jgi:hypothetical protein
LTLNNLDALPLFKILNDNPDIPAATAAPITPIKGINIKDNTIDNTDAISRFFLEILTLLVINKTTSTGPIMTRNIQQREIINIGIYAFVYNSPNRDKI